MKKKDASGEPRPEENRTAPESGGIPPKKKAALLRYLAILFGVAFLLVLLSLFIQMRDSRETISDMAEDKESVLQKVLTLQEQTETLNAENKDLSDRLAGAEARADAAEKTVSEQKDEIAALEAKLEETAGDADAAHESSAITGETAQAWELLAKLERAAAEEDRAAAQALESEITPLLNRLPAEAQLRVRSLLEQWKTEPEP